MKPIVWSIAGSDSGGGAGIQADLKTFAALGVHGCTVVTAVTAQNTTRIESVEALPDACLTKQIQLLRDEFEPAAIKTGLLPSYSSIEQVGKLAASSQCRIICDPVLVASCGTSLTSSHALTASRELFYSRVEVLTPNISEAETLLGAKIRTFDEMESAAHALLEWGPHSIFLKGGHLTSDGNELASDFWTDGKSSFWISAARLPNVKTHGTGCTFSAALTASLARGHSLTDALVLAKAYVRRGIRLASVHPTGVSLLFHGRFPEDDTHPSDLPWITAEKPGKQQRPFPRTEKPLGFYPLVSRAEALATLLRFGVSLAQLRIKDLSGVDLESEIAQACSLAKQAGCRLFINDYWELAAKHGAYGVHLGQEDLDGVEVEAMRETGLRLGISTHCLEELARARAVQPTYYALGPIYETTCKSMRFGPQGVSGVRQWRSLIDDPLVAIGGLTVERAREIIQAGADGIAVISDLTRAPSLAARVDEWATLFKRE